MEFTVIGSWLLFTCQFATVAQHSLSPIRHLLPNHTGRSMRRPFGWPISTTNRQGAQE